MEQLIQRQQVAPRRPAIKGATPAYEGGLGGGGGIYATQRVALRDRRPREAWRAPTRAPEGGAPRAAEAPRLFRWVGSNSGARADGPILGLDYLARNKLRNGLIARRPAIHRASTPETASRLGNPGPRQPGPRHPKLGEALVQAGKELSAGAEAGLAFGAGLARETGRLCRGLYGELFSQGRHGEARDGLLPPPQETRSERRRKSARETKPRLEELREAFSRLGSRPKGKGATRADRPDRPVRLALHARFLPILAAAAAALILLILGGTALLRAIPSSFPLPAGELLPAEPSAESLLLSYISPELDPPEEGAVLPPAPPSLEIQTYKVRPGDSVGAIAARFGIRADSLVSMNGIKNARSLKSGTELRVPNMDGLLHSVAKGESLASIAARYKVEPSLLADANDLGSSLLRPGQAVFIPGARIPEAELKRVFGEYAVWPLRGPLSSAFGYRDNPFTGVRQFHTGIDIVAPSGTPIKAAMDGTVADAGYNVIFGNYVILNHAEGVQTLYGHMTKISVVRGQRLSQGATVGTVGSTGYSTGPHLHFGFFRGGTPVNPAKYLK